MKTKILTTLLLTLTLTGCQKKSEDTKTSKAADPVAKAQFEKSDAIINKYLDRLESPNTTIEEKTRILCKNYPDEYKTNYMPALLRLQLYFPERSRCDKRNDKHQLYLKHLHLF